MTVTIGRFAKLGVGILLIWLMMTHICPAIVEIVPGYKAYAEQIDQRGITTSALFYNDVKESAEAELYLRNALRP